MSAEDRFAAALARRDPAALAALYAEAAETAPDADARAVLLTHARVHALEAGSPLEASIHRALIDMGRDA